VFAQDPCERFAIKMILTDEFAIIFHDWNPGVVFLAPVVAAVNIVDNELELAAYQGPQFFDHDPTKMAVLTAVYNYRFHCRPGPGSGTRLSTTGTKLRKQEVCLTRQRLTTRPAAMPVSAANAAAESRSENAYASVAPAIAPSMGTP
jgi:hypothetical protein